MIWGENNQFPFYIKGGFSHNIQIMLMRFCDINHINRHGYNFNSNVGRYTLLFIGGNQHIIMDSLPEDIIYQKVDPFTFIKYYLCGTEPQWYENLKVGDTVVIDHYKEGKSSSDYPFSFTEDMEIRAGDSFEILKKELWDDPSYMIGMSEFNGDFNYYLISEPNGYTWHSSMFKDPSIKSIKKLILGEIEDFIL